MENIPKRTKVLPKQVEEEDDSRMTNREKFEIFYEKQWQHRKFCLKCENYKIPDLFPKNKSILFCQACCDELTLDEKLAIANKLAAIESEKENRFKY